MTKTKLPPKVSKWEIGGVPAAAILEILYEMESLPEMVKADLPRYMLLAFILFALVRAYQQRRAQEAAEPAKEAAATKDGVPKAPDAKVEKKPDVE